MPYCPKCGKEVKEDAAYCPYCGESMKPREVIYRYGRDEKSEKNEKDERNEKAEKNEKDEKGEKNEKDNTVSAVMGGIIVLWLGVAFLLREYGFISSSDVGYYFLIGIGVVLLGRGLIAFSQDGSWAAGSGFIIGGLVVASIGVVGIMGWQNWWPLVFILIGAWIILSSVMAKSRSPRP